MPTNFPAIMVNSVTSQTITVRNEVQATAFLNSGTWAQQMGQS